VAVKHRGQALVEYLVATTAIAAALFVPLPDGLSAAQRLLEVLGRWVRNYAFLVATG
jgi:hypothetical protein